MEINTGENKTPIQEEAKPQQDVADQVAEVPEVVEQPAVVAEVPVADPAPITLQVNATNELTKISQTEKTINEYKEKYTMIDPQDPEGKRLILKPEFRIVDTQTDDEARKARKTIKTTRTGIGKDLKEIKRMLDEAKGIASEKADDLTSKVLAVESLFDAEIEAYELAKEKQKEEKQKQQEQKIISLREELKSYVANKEIEISNCQTSEEIDAIVAGIASPNPDIELILKAELNMSILSIKSKAQARKTEIENLKLKEQLQQQEKENNIRKEINQKIGDFSKRIEEATTEEQISVVLSEIEASAIADHGFETLHVEYISALTNVKNLAKIQIGALSQRAENEKQKAEEERLNGLREKIANYSEQIRSALKFLSTPEKVDEAVNSKSEFPCPDPQLQSFYDAEMKTIADFAESRKSEIQQAKEKADAEAREKEEREAREKAEREKAEAEQAEKKRILDERIAKVTAIGFAAINDGKNYEYKSIRLSLVEIETGTPEEFAAWLSSIEATVKDIDAKDEQRRIAMQPAKERLSEWLLSVKGSTLNVDGFPDEALAVAKEISERFKGFKDWAQKLIDEKCQ